MRQKSMLYRLLEAGGVRRLWEAVDRVAAELENEPPDEDDVQSQLAPGDAPTYIAHEDANRLN